MDLAGDSDAGLAEHVGDLSLTQARGVVFERQLVLGLIYAEAAQAIGVREFAQMAQLFFGERGLQFVGNFHESHSGIIAARLRGTRQGLAAEFDKDRDRGYI
jgi:hypothetical protein